MMARIVLVGQIEVWRTYSMAYPSVAAPGTEQDNLGSQTIMDLGMAATYLGAQLRNQYDCRGPG